MDRYGELVAFTRAVTEGGFSAAAFSLSLTPSAVSKLVSRLEDRLYPSHELLTHLCEVSSGAA
jgi:DNA-binding transcriptional LysR family regulator